MSQKPTTALSELPPTFADDVKRMMHQVMICMVKRAGGKIEIPVAEVDDTGDDMMYMEIDEVRRVFIFKTEKKQ